MRALFTVLVGAALFLWLCRAPAPTLYTLSAEQSKNQTKTKLVHIHPSKTNSVSAVKVGFSTKLLSQADAFSILNSISDDQLSGYLAGVVPYKPELDRIHQRRFARRAISELYEPSSIEVLLGRIAISTSKTHTQTDAALGKLDSDARLYAHLHAAPDVHAGRIVIQWLHVDSSSVVLFKMKYIDPNSSKNWVSLRPTDGWRKGVYEVVYYQYNSTLTPIAKHRFTINQVNNQLDDEDDVFSELGITPDDIPQDDMQDSQESEHPIFQQL